MLITKLNSRIRADGVLPQAVKTDLCQRMRGKGITVLAAQEELLMWAVTSMPVIVSSYESDVAPEKGQLKHQIVDAMQHYRFGFQQAKELIRLSGTSRFNDAAADRTLALFTSVHDIGRMMVGSGASADVYGAQGNFLHPIVGAIMLREAFAPLMRQISGNIADLMQALIITAERHTLSIGLMASSVEEQNIRGIMSTPYLGYKGSLLMADVQMGEYGRYAHLIALADLINNPSVKGLPGVQNYDSLVGLETMSPAEQIEYILSGPGRGAFEVVKIGETAPTFVERVWTNKPTEDNCENWQTQMERDAIRFQKEKPAITVARNAFRRGWQTAFT